MREYAKIYRNMPSLVTIWSQDKFLTKKRSQLARKSMIVCSCSRD